MKTRAILLWTTACAPGSELFLDRPWPKDEPAVVIATANHDVIAVDLILPGVHPFVFETKETVEIYARTYAGLGERAIEACTASVDGQGVELGPPIGAWRSAVDFGAKALSLEPELDPRPFDVRLTGCDVTSPSCELGAVNLSSAPSHFGLMSVVSLSERTAIACGSQRSETDAEILVVRIEDDRVDVLPSIGAPSLCNGLALHGDLVAGAAGRTLFFLDSLGAVVKTSTINLWIVQVASGADGTFMVAADGRMVMIPPGTTEVVPFAGPAFSPGTERPKIDVASTARLVMLAPNSGMYVYEGTWRRELESVLNFDTMAIDDVALLAVPEAESMLLLHDGEELWTPLGHPFLANRAISATSLGSGRFLVGGQNGRAAYFNGDRVCDTFTPTDRNIEDIDFAPGARSGFAVGENEGSGTPPLVLKITLPD